VTREPPSAAVVARACADRIDEIVVWLGLAPAAKRMNLFTPLNPMRGDRHPGSFVIYGRGHAKQGGWVDYACPPAPGSKAANLSGDALDLISYIKTGNPRDRKAGYALGLAFLGWEGAAHLDRPGQEQARRALERDREIAEKNAREALEADRRKAFQRWLSDAQLSFDDLVWRYLKGRGIDLAHMIDRLPHALRLRAEDFHREAGVKRASMAALISSPDGKPWSVHRTFLDVRGAVVQKAQLDPPRKIWPGGYQGGAIRLAKGANACSPEEAVRQGLCGEVLAVGEGVETMLSVALACPTWRAWAAGNVGAIGAVVVPASVEMVVLVGENDDGEQARAAFDRGVAAMAHQAKAKGFQLYVTRPKPGDDDFNTSLQKLGERVE
jgi:hypothetical protein